DTRQIFDYVIRLVPHIADFTRVGPVHRLLAENTHARLAARMESRGKLIVIEGIDGSGKRTQTERLGSALGARGIPFSRFSFPRYESFFGQLVAKFLNGDFGPLEAVDPHFSALLYAGDRFEVTQEMKETLAAGKNILTDRYVPSNLAHQAARIAPERRDRFMDWLRQLEYGIYQLPAEDLVVYLRLNARNAQQLVERKKERSY